MTSKRTFLFARLLLAVPAFAVMLCNVHASQADLVFTIINPVRIAPPGSVELFQGTIGNETLTTLTSTDLLLNFSGYDPANVSLDQLLGMTFFSIPSGSTSGVLDLFTFSLASTAVVPATYPADVVLESSAEDLSPVQTVSVSTIISVVPEPSSLALGATILAALLIAALGSRTKLATVIFAILAVAPTLATAQVSGVQFVTGSPGLGRLDQTLFVALPIMNNGGSDATNVQVTGATLRMASLISPLSFPVQLGTIAPNHSAVFQANFNAANLALNTSYLLTVRGTYLASGVATGFTVNRFIGLPSAAGAGSAKTITVQGNSVSGAPFPPGPAGSGAGEQEEQNIGRPVPTGPFILATPASPATVVQDPDSHFDFVTNTHLERTSAWAVAEPSGASAGNVVFVSYNGMWTGPDQFDGKWSHPRAAYSIDGGATFHEVNPETIFGDDEVGYCCDQIVQYSPSIDRFIWLIQGCDYANSDAPCYKKPGAKQGVRLAVASPADIMNSNGTAWTYWKLTPDLFGDWFPSGTTFDYPDLSVGTNYLYVSWNANKPSCTLPCGLEVIRVPLLELQNFTVIHPDASDPSKNDLARASHLTQNTEDEVFWAGQNLNSSLRIYSWAEDEPAPFSRDVPISSWANTKLESSTPDGSVLLCAGCWFNVLGATRDTFLNQLWFAWNAGVDSNFPQPHIEMVKVTIIPDTIDRYQIEQAQIWNNDYAFGYPALSSSSCPGFGIGLSLGSGGNNKYYADHVVGFWGDFKLYKTTHSDLGPGSKYGDYFTIRQNSDNLGFWDAFGYGVHSQPGGGNPWDVRYVLFGRACPQ
jgi:hypothetical protein